MKLSYNWLQEYVQLPDPKQVAALITAHVAEVEHVDNLAERLQHIVVGEVLEARKHSDADKLNVGQFDVGEGKPRQIVFGGKALLKPGDKLPVALPGAKLPNGIVIAERKLRGEQSRGMCCLNSELQILDSAERVEFLPADAKNGMPISEALGLDDAIITIDNKTLTHRPDLFCHIGFARELSVILKQPLKLPALMEVAAGDRLEYNVTIEATADCRRYMGLVMDKVTVKPSPDWLQRRLTSIGLRPINNVVDITNYVMYEYGQPLHAFDYSMLTGKQVKVRMAKKGEQLKTLDGITHKLTNQLVIADETKAEALAGVMGGADSQITDQTTMVALESANFKASTIRLGAQQLSLRTDASTRHEKNLPLVLAELGLWRCVQLMQELAGAEVASKMIDERTVEEPQLSISLDLQYVRRLMGVNISVEVVHSTLTALGCQVTGEDTMTVVPPTHRTDLTIAEELIEEVARVYGYSKIEPQPLVATLVPQVTEPAYAVAEQLIRQAAQAGAYEVTNYSFYSEATAKRFALDSSKHTRMLNPMNPDQTLLRTFLRPNLLLCAEENLDHGERDFTLVEYGHVYLATGEEKRFGLCCVGATPDVVRKAKGLAIWLGLGGKVVLDQIGKWYAASIECDVPTVNLMAKQFQPLPEFPGIELDISVDFPSATAWSDIEQSIKQAGGTLLSAVSVFDIYNSALGIRLHLQAKDRTLTMDEAEQLRHTIIQALQTKFNATHRK